MTVTIADFNVGNLHSLQKAFQKLGADTVMTPDVRAWLDAEVLVIPGDGAFAAMMAPIEGHREALAERVRSGPTLGICIGLQIAFEASTEDPHVAGLGVLDGTIERLPADRLPHMGWNTVRHSSSELFEEIPDESYFYFVHSYGALAHGAAIAWTDYGGPIVAGVEMGPASYAVQFHPEKSAPWGLKLLENFLTIAEDAR
ncbi:MAG: imidazole glycerol phosphate synthase subunit HisH [Candidatus Bipolaricaulia bacterium]